MVPDTSWYHTGFLFHLQDVPLLLWCCGSCAVIRRFLWCCVQGYEASGFRDNLPWPSSSLNDSHTNVCHNHYKNDFNCWLSLSEISDLNLRERWSDWPWGMVNSSEIYSSSCVHRAWHLMCSTGACPREFLLYFFNKVYFFFMVPDTSWYQICFSSLFINSPDQEQLTLY